MIRVAINGFGRIGRIAFRQMLTSRDFDVVAVNSKSGTSEELSYLTIFDSVHRLFHENEISFDDNNIIICDKKKVKVFNESDPEKLPWKDLNIDLVLECTGAFTDTAGAYKHIKAGAKKVLISAPAKDEVKTIVYGVNHNILTKDDVIVSSSSCTTNCLAPVLNVLEKNFGIVKGFMSTIHAYTSDQNNLDGTHKKGITSRRGRACAENIVPATTGAAKSIGLVIPSLKGKMDGIAYRVPVADGSLVDVTLELKKDVSIKDINDAFAINQNDVLKASNYPMTSSDIIGQKYGAVVDMLSTNIVENNGKKLVKVVAFYDNEYGYTAQMLKTAKSMFRENN